MEALLVSNAPYPRRHSFISTDAHASSMLRKRAECRLSHRQVGCCSGGGGAANGGGHNRDGSGGGDENEEWSFRRKGTLLLGAAILCCNGLRIGAQAAAAEQLESEVHRTPGTPFWEVEDGKWKRYVVDHRGKLSLDCVKLSEEEATSYEKEVSTASLQEVASKTRSSAGIARWCVNFLSTAMLPIGYPKSVTEDYTEYTAWRLGQIIASQINGVLTTQALLYAVGLGKGAIPAAAAINWVLKDGIGYMSKIVLSKYGRHFDVNPKGWRLFSDIVEDVASGLELLTPSFPQFFVPLTAVAAAGKSASGLIQGATRSCFYAGFAAQHNFAEVIAKGEAQGMLGKSIGIAMGIGIAGKVGASGPLLVSAFGAVISLHVLCNLRSYQAVQLITLNPYRTGLLVSELLEEGKVLSSKEVNSVEPVFAALSSALRRLSPVTSRRAQAVAADVAKNLQLGVRFGEVASTEAEAKALLNLYRDEQYVLAFKKNGYKVVLKDGALPSDMLRAVVQACYIAYLGMKQDAASLTSSYEKMKHNYEHLMRQLDAAGWLTDGLVARPASNRILCKSH